MENIREKVLDETNEYPKIAQSNGSPFNVKKTILYSNKLQDITDMIDENEEKVAVYEKTNQNNEWSGAEFLSFN